MAVNECTNGGHWLKFYNHIDFDHNKYPMELKVCNNTSLQEVKDLFSTFFPYLKLEFFIYRHPAGKELYFDRQAYKGIYLSETSDFFKEGIVKFSPSTTVGELELQFQIELGLVAKVFRRSGGLWVDASQTAHLTLGKQNSVAAALARPIKFNLHTLFL
jgi:hypothetical protein